MFGIQPVVARNRLRASVVAAVGIPHAPQGQGEGAIQPLNLAGWCKGGHYSLLAAGQSLAMVFLVVHAKDGISK